MTVTSLTANTGHSCIRVEFSPNLLTIVLRLRPSDEFGEELSHDDGHDLVHGATDSRFVHAKTVADQTEVASVAQPPAINQSIRLIN
jgi:hypothetical protein